MTETRQCKSCNKDFLLEPEDFAFYAKVHVPPPTWCPECRMKRRLIFRNERKAWMRPDTRTGEMMFSGMPPRLTKDIYAVEYWRSDAWDPLEYGRDYDPSRPFLEQFRELLYAVPWPGQSTLGSVNSEYSDQNGYCKNAYLCFNGDYIEDSAYVVRSSYIKDSFDLTECMRDELCYSSIMTDQSHRVFFSSDCEQSTDIWFSRDLVGCSDCFGCTNLRKRSYCIWNEQYSKEEYEKKIAEIWDGSWSAYLTNRAKAESLHKQYPVRYLHGYRNYGSSGERVRDTKNAKYCYSVADAENVKYLQWVPMSVKESYDYSVWGNAASLVYESMTCGEQATNLKFCFDCWPGVRDLEYSMFCRSSADLFGCVGLKKKQFCILNKQYSKEEYLALREKIVEQMASMPYRDKQGREYRYGEFFPPEFSPFAYNESVLQDVFPLSAEAARSAGYLWEEVPPKEYQTTLKASDLADRISDVPEEIVKELIACAECGRAYRVLANELHFLRRMGIPLPRTCVDCRARERFAGLNPPTFINRPCDCGGAASKHGGYENTGKHLHGEGECGNIFLTSYSADASEVIYCEACYQSEVS